MLRNFPDIRSVNCNLSFCHIVKSRNQIYQRRFTASGTSDKCGCLSRFCCKWQIMQYIFFSSRIAERNMFKCNFTLLIFRKCPRCFRIIDLCLALQYFVYTGCWYCCSRKHDWDHTNHQECHNNLHCILDKCHHIANLHCSIIDTVPTAPYNQNGNTVHNQHHYRHHKCHGTVDK